MTGKLQEIAVRFSDIEKELCSPACLSDPARSAELMRERKRLLPVAEGYGEYKKAEDDYLVAKSLLEEPQDALSKELLEDELKTAQAHMSQWEEKLKILLLPRDEDDDKNVCIEIRGGAGGEEAALFAGSLFRMYSMYALEKGYHIDVVYANETELGGFKEISFMIEGEGAFSRFKFESGVHRVQRVPETESGGRIHTSTVTVAVLPEAEEVDFEINPTDLQIDTFRSSGAGGQHINKTESAIRITHLPTGTVVECQDERSQYKNKDKALKVLRSRLLEEERRKKNAEIADARKLQVGTGDRSERIRTYNFPQGRVTDHRIGLTLYKIEAIMNGDLDELLDALITADTAEKLKASND